jgi:hypothetical protein
MFYIISNLDPGQYWDRTRRRGRKGRLTLGINMNAGQRINLRLRPPGSPDGFYEFDQLVLVMLHEVGPFYPISYIENGIWKMELMIAYSYSIWSA